MNDVINIQMTLCRKIFKKRVPPTQARFLIYDAEITKIQKGREASGTTVRGVVVTFGVRKGPGAHTRTAKSGHSSLGTFTFYPTCSYSVFNMQIFIAYICEFHENEYPQSGISLFRKGSQKC